MIRIDDRFAGDRITLYCAETQDDARWIYRASLRRMVWALDTESTGLNCYKPGWKLRTFQFGDATRAYVLPAKFRRTIRRVLTRQGVQWIGHNGPHDIRCLDVHCGEMGVRCDGETYIASHHRDSRNRAEGGVGHELKELGKQIDPQADRWETELKRVFKQIEIPVKGEVYKSGPRKGQQKVRKARLDEGWALIDPWHPAYIAYAAVDPIITFRVWQRLRGTVRETRERYDFDLRVQLACDRLQRRALPLDVPYTQRLSARYLSKATELMERASTVYGCNNVHSGQQVAKTLQRLGVRLSKRTKGGNQYATDSTVLRGLLSDERARDFVLTVLGAKQLIKRRESYTEQMLAEMDSEGRVHPSINTLGARTTRMSVSRPPLQQLPTKDNESELGESISET